ncbi:phage portal protein [Vulgatibacter sp.]|uniref:phage portal protein n=1 Tax=Vulgatibacter sp. TaxID=1971226 RepID=UPI003561FF0A
MGFLSSFLGSSESIRLSDPSALERLRLSGRTHAGASVDEYSAMALPTVFAAIGIIADAIAQLPLDVRQKLAGGGSREATEHPAHQMLRAEPNDDMTSFAFRNTVTGHAVGWGNGYADIERNGRGQAVALWPLLPDRTRPRKDPNTGARDFLTSVNGRAVALRPDDVLHIPGFGFDGLRGYCPITLHREALGLALATQEFGAKFFGQGGRSGGVIELPPGTTPEAAKLIKKVWTEQEGLEHSHRAKVLPDGAKYTATAVPPEEAQFLQTREFQIAEIARIFRVPLHMLQAQSKSTSWGSGIEQMSLGFVRYTLAPWIARWEQELNRKLFTPQERLDGFYVKFNVNALLRGDAKSRAEFYKLAIDASWMEPSEARELEDLDPIPGLNERPRHGAAPGARAGARRA